MIASPGRLILIRNRLGMMHVLMHGRSLLMRLSILSRDNGLAVSAIGRHGNRIGQRVSAEQRQPNGQNYCTKFSERTKHGLILAKNRIDVKQTEAMRRNLQLNCRRSWLVLRKLHTLFVL